MISQKTSYDAIVIGGGPAGSSTAALLAQKGHDVLVVEKENSSVIMLENHHAIFPSMPLPLKDRLADTLMPSNLRKYCSIRSTWLSFPTLHFFQHFDHPSSTTWQVWRSEFDHKD